MVECDELSPLEVRDSCIYTSIGMVLRRFNDVLPWKYLLIT